MTATTRPLPEWDKAVDRWLNLYRPSTAAAYRYGIDRWNTWCAQHDLDPWFVRRGDVESHLAEPLAVATIATT